MLHFFAWCSLQIKYKLQGVFKNILEFLTQIYLCMFAYLASLWVSQTLTFFKAISTLQAPLDSNRKRGLACYLFLSNKSLASLYTSIEEESQWQEEILFL
jgi:hypothetical protein